MAYKDFTSFLTVFCKIKKIFKQRTTKLKKNLQRKKENKHARVTASCTT